VEVIFMKTEDTTSGRTPPSRDGGHDRLQKDTHIDASNVPGTSSRRCTGAAPTRKLSPLRAGCTSVILVVFVVLIVMSAGLAGGTAEVGRPARVFLTIKLSNEWGP
jgi:hypothetical protein